LSNYLWPGPTPSIYLFGLPQLSYGRFLSAYQAFPVEAQCTFLLTAPSDTSMGSGLIVVDTLNNQPAGLNTHRITLGIKYFAQAIRCYRGLI
jgi:hypothetical protein